MADYDAALAVFVGKLGFEVVEDAPSTSDAAPDRARRWPVIAPPGAGAEILLARVETEARRARIGDQAADRVLRFLRTDDFERDAARYRAVGDEFVREPKCEPCGTVAVLRDVSGNLWDLTGPPQTA